MHELEHLLYQRHPELAGVQQDIEAARAALVACFEGGGKLLVCGNGGSAADADHIVGELMKGFLLPRPLGEEQRAHFATGGPEGERLAGLLQGALPAIALHGAPALSTAFGNDVLPEAAFAQQVLGYGRAGDALLALSTSGGAANVVAAARTARALGLVSICLTGEGGGALAPLCDIAIRLPARDTYRVQELTLPVYHALCAAVEAHFFAPEN